MTLENSVYRDYLIDLVSLLQERAEDAMKKTDQMGKETPKLKDERVFQDGRFAAYQEVLTTMMHQLETFQIPLAEVNFHKIDQSLLLCNKPQDESNSWK